VRWEKHLGWICRDGFIRNQDFTTSSVNSIGRLCHFVPIIVKSGASGLVLTLSLFLFEHGFLANAAWGKSTFSTIVVKEASR
jgi:hypothetical protein